MQVVQNHAEEFLEKMNCKEIAVQLRALRLIPETVEHEILQSSSRSKANAHLFNYLKEDAKVETVKIIFGIASKETGYGKMNDFAVDMLQELQ